LELDFHHRVRAAFLELAAAPPAPTTVLDAARPVEALAEEIRGLVGRLLGQSA